MSASKSSEADELKSQLASAQQSLASANADRASLSERVTAAEAKANAEPAKSNEAEELRTQLAAAQQELAAAKAAAAQVATTPVPSAPTEDVAALHKQLDEAQGKLDAALRTYQLQQEEQDRLQKALANIDGERASLADRLQTANTQTSQATAQAAVNQDATVQLAATREQLRRSKMKLLVWPRKIPSCAFAPLFRRLKTTAPTHLLLRRSALRLAPTPRAA